MYDIPENSHYFKGVGQAFSLFTIKEGIKTKSIDIVIPVDSVKIGNAPVYSSTSIDTYQSITNHIAILPFSQSELAFLVKVENNSKIKEHPQIVNLRGELDMTFDKKFISDSESKYQFVQGSNVSLYELKNLRKFVDPDFFPREKGVWSKDVRIACQQISNMNQVRRLKWALVPRDHILANSCNFLALDDSGLFKQDRTFFLPYLLAVMNSSFMNYRFKLLSANNHISNTEIANFPLIIPDSNTLQSVKEMVDEVVRDFDPNKCLKLEKFLMEIYDLGDFSALIDSNTRIGSLHAFWSR
jgi:Alw26I/Eco31I/Esp3I family type II restriction m6 adenine DNA methyltransferase